MAHRHAVSVIERHPSPSQFIQVRSLVGLTSIALQHFLPDVIGKDEQNVGRPEFACAGSIHPAKSKQHDCFVCSVHAQYFTRNRYPEVLCERKKVSRSIGGLGRSLGRSKRLLARSTAGGDRRSRA